MAQDSLYIVMPAYNESSNIQNTIEEWYPVVEKVGGNSRLAVFDDGSSDNTYEVLKNLSQSHPLLVAQTKANSGHGATVLKAYKYALKSGADYVFQTDSDGQTVPEEFWELWENRKKYDAQIGWRKKRQDGLSRIMVTKVLKIVVKRRFKTDVTDANCPFRLMNAESLARNIKLIPEDFNLSNVMLSVIYAKRNQAVRYVPITFRPRQGGTNSINLKSITKIGKKALSDFKLLNKELDKALK